MRGPLAPKRASASKSTPRVKMHQPRRLLYVLLLVAQRTAFSKAVTQFSYCPSVDKNSPNGLACQRCLYDEFCPPSAPTCHHIHKVCYDSTVPFQCNVNATISDMSTSASCEGICNPTYPPFFCPNACLNEDFPCKWVPNCNPNSETHMACLQGCEDHSSILPSRLSLCSNCAQCKAVYTCNHPDVRNYCPVTCKTQECSARCGRDEQGGKEHGMAVKQCWEFIINDGKSCNEMIKRGYDCHCSCGDHYAMHRPYAFPASTSRSLPKPAFFVGRDHGGVDLGLNVTMTAGQYFRIQVSGVGLASATGGQTAKIRILQYQTANMGCAEPPAPHMMGMDDTKTPFAASTFYNAWDNVKIDGCGSFKVCHCNGGCLVQSDWNHVGTLNIVSPAATVLPASGFVRPLPNCPSVVDHYMPYLPRNTPDIDERAMNAEEDTEKVSQLRVVFLLRNWQQSLFDSTWERTLKKVLALELRSFNPLLNEWIPNEAENDIVITTSGTRSPFWSGRQLGEVGPEEKIETIEIAAPVIFDRSELMTQQEAEEQRGGKNSRSTPREESKNSNAALAVDPLANAGLLYHDPKRHIARQRALKEAEEASLLAQNSRNSAGENSRIGTWFTPWRRFLTRLFAGSPASYEANKRKFLRKTKPEEITNNGKTASTTDSNSHDMVQPSGSNTAIEEASAVHKQQSPGHRDNKNPTAGTPGAENIKRKLTIIACEDDDTAFHSIMGDPLTSCHFAATMFGLAAVCTGKGTDLERARAAGCQGTCIDYICNVNVNNANAGGTTSTTVTTQNVNTFLPAGEYLYGYVKIRTEKSKEQLKQKADLMRQDRVKLQATAYHFAKESLVTNWPDHMWVEITEEPTVTNQPPASTEAEDEEFTSSGLFVALLCVLAVGLVVGGAMCFCKRQAQFQDREEEDPMIAKAKKIALVLLFPLAGLGFVAVKGFEKVKAYCKGPPESEDEQDLWEPPEGFQAYAGAEVVLKNLTKLEYNGLKGKLMKYVEDKERWLVDVVVFQSTVEEEHKELSLKPENFRVLKPQHGRQNLARAKGRWKGGLGILGVGGTKTAPAQDEGLFEELNLPDSPEKVDHADMTAKTIDITKQRVFKPSQPAGRLPIRPREPETSNQVVAVEKKSMFSSFGGMFGGGGASKTSATSNQAAIAGNSNNNRQLVQAQYGVKSYRRPK
ncbi:unnamed protein product [Amoebophrya sp. A120]|nr:unnamed protein product [Amoebophrya sp. A120]|eukprot:GSA120T00010232001.1